MRLALYRPDTPQNAGEALRQTGGYPAARRVEPVS